MGLNELARLELLAGQRGLRVERREQPHRVDQQDDRDQHLADEESQYEQQPISHRQQAASGRVKGDVAVHRRRNRAERGEDLLIARPRLVHPDCRRLVHGKPRDIALQLREGQPRFREPRLGEGLAISLQLTGVARVEHLLLELDLLFELLEFSVHTSVPHCPGQFFAAPGTLTDSFLIDEPLATMTNAPSTGVA
jgi:hypothetical protein